MTENHRAPDLETAYQESLVRVDAEIAAALAKLPPFARRQITPALEAVRGFLELASQEHLRDRYRLDLLADHLEADLNEAEARDGT